MCQNARQSASPKKEYVFEGAVEALKFGRMTYHVVFLARDLQVQSPFAAGGTLRMQGTIGGETVFLAWLFAHGRHYLLVNRVVLHRAKLALGSPVVIAFSLLPHDAVRLPAELAEALRQEPSWRALWQELTAGVQRGLCYRVESAKLPETRARRAVDILRSLEEGRPLGPPRRSRWE